MSNSDMVSLLCLVFQYDPGFQEDPSQPFSDSDDDVNDTDGSFFVVVTQCWKFLLRRQHVTKVLH